MRVRNVPGFCTTTAAALEAVNKRRRNFFGHFWYPPPPCRNFNPDLPNPYLLILQHQKLRPPSPPKKFQRLLRMAPCTKWTDREGTESMFKLKVWSKNRQFHIIHTYIQVFPKYILLFWWRVDFFAHKSLPSHSQSQWHIGQWQTEMEIF